MRVVLSTLVGGVLAFSNVFATEVGALPQGKGVNVLTLHMKRFSQLEAELHNAVNRRDRTTLGKMLSAFFEIRRPAGAVAQSESWLEERVPTDGVLHDLAVYETGGNAIASFTLRSPHKADRFITDVWTMEEGEWRLRIRFESPLANAKLNSSGAKKTRSANQDTRPTGK